jgi:MinD-like ATPase involved in chromosome partitioning or flagellar assembly
MMALASAGIFVLRYPEHPMAVRIERLAQLLIA